MKTMTFSTKSKNWSGSLEVSLKMPSTLEDMDLIREKFGSVERMIAEANRNFAIACQNGMRKRKSKEEAKDYAEKFVDDGRKDTYVQRVELDKEQFTPEQIEILKKAGAILK